MMDINGVGLNRFPGDSSSERLSVCATAFDCNDLCVALNTLPFARLP